MLSKERRMEVLEAYDLTKSFRAAAQLTGVDHKTVAHVVAARALGRLLEPEPPRTSVADGFAAKISEWIERSSGRIRADVVHERLVAMGYTGSERTTRRVVAAMKENWRADHHRIYKPWIPEPGLWLQYDFAEGPVVEGVKTVLFCAWLAWSRFRVILALRDRSLPSVVAALDTTFRLLGGGPTYVLTDNEKTVTDHHVAGIAVRNREMLSVAHYYGVTVATCAVADPETKGGSEATVKLAKADVVPTQANLLDDYASFAELERACARTMDELNTRVHAVTRRVPAEALQSERAQLHRVPDAPYTAAFGQSRAVGWSATVSYLGARYSVPQTLVGTRVWVRVTGSEVVIVAGEGERAHEVARHRLLGPGQASIDDRHYAPRPRRPEDRRPRPANAAEASFLALGEGASRYLIEAAGAGVYRVKSRMAEAVALSALHGADAVDRALGLAATAGRFAEGDLESILVHRAGAVRGPVTPPASHSLASGTASWDGLGTRPVPTP